MEDLANLVDRSRRGDVEAYAEVVARFQNMAYGYAYSLLRDLDRAEDAAQEAFIEAYRKLGQLREPAAFPGWFRRIVYKHCDRLTRGKHSMTVPLDDVAYRLEAAEPEPAELVIGRERSDRVLSAVEALPDADRAVTTLFYIDGYSQAEIAGFLGITVTTVKNRLRAARRRLRDSTMGLVADTLRSQSLPEAFTRQTVDRLQRLVAEFDRHWLEDPLAASTDGLAEGLALLSGADAGASAAAEASPEAVHAAYDVYARLGDRPEAIAGLLELLTGYLQRDLPAEEEAWARWNVVSALGGLALAGLGSFEEAYREHERLVSWARRMLPRDDLLWVIHAPFHAGCWSRAGHEEEWWALYREVMEGTIPQPSNRWWRLQCLTTAGHRMAMNGRVEDAEEIARRIEALAQEDPEWPERSWATITGPIVRMHACLCAGDHDRLERLGAEALALIEASEPPAPRPAAPPRERWRRVHGVGTFGGVWDMAGYQDPADPEVALAMAYHWVGTALYAAGRHARAIEVLGRSMEHGNTSPHIYLCYAASVWAVTRDRARTLGVLRRFAPAISRLPQALERCSEFRDVVDDPEFRDAAAGEDRRGGAWDLPDGVSPRPPDDDREAFDDTAEG